MEYISTRGSAPPVDFQTTLLTGLAPDGGLYVPARWPALGDLSVMADRPYAEVAAAVMAPFTSGFADQDELAVMADDAYARFGHAEVAPLRSLGEDRHLLELFWGPTLAFKDMAMQMLGRMVDRALDASGRRATIIGATSGDTGSAAIEAFRDRDHVDVAILYPHGRVSDVQRRQMTTVPSANVHAIAIDGTFDDCQDIVKGLFADVDTRTTLSLSTANSINWGRVVAQVPYYVWAAARIGASRLSFAVPSGNFGNVYSGYVAASMGLPIDRFVVGSNRNNVLARFLEDGELTLGEVHPTIAPSMDIQIPSNLERLLFDLEHRDGPGLQAAMLRLRAEGHLRFDHGEMSPARERFVSAWFDDDGIRAIMQRVYEALGVVVDPHTAVGIGAAEAAAVPGPVVCLGTAHPAKFPDTVEEAIGLRPPLPDHLADLLEREERVTRLAADPDAVRSYLLDALA